jgi:hypothetical protein
VATIGQDKSADDYARSSQSGLTLKSYGLTSIYLYIYYLLSIIEQTTSD